MYFRSDCLGDFTGLFGSLHFSHTQTMNVDEALIGPNFTPLARLDTSALAFIGGVLSIFDKNQTFMRWFISKRTYILGPLSAHQRNAITMAFRWWADGDPYFVFQTGLVNHYR